MTKSWENLITGVAVVKVLSSHFVMAPTTKSNIANQNRTTILI